MTKEFVPYNESLELKELGFDEPCFGYYDSEGLQPSDGFWWNRENKNSLFVESEKTNNPKNSAPTFSQAFRFFREKYNLRNSIMDFDFIIDKRIGIKWDYEISIIGSNKLDENGNYKVLVDYSIDDETREFKTYEEAELACLQKLIELCKK